MARIKLFFLLLVHNAYFSKIPIYELQIKTTKSYTSFVELINRNVFFKNIILVNLNDEVLFKNLHGALRFNFINRFFFAPNLGVSNEAYLIASRNYSDLIEGIDDVKRDFFWNPKAVFFILITDNVEFKPKIFQMLHDMYIFHINLIFTSRFTDCIIYSYDFNKSAQCSFTFSAINREVCDNFKPVSESHNMINNFKSKGLEMFQATENKKNEIPYSGCKNITLLVIPAMPSAFPSVDGTNKKEIGFEEVFYTIMQEMGFFNFTFVFVDDDIGFLSENHTVTGLLKQVQDGVADGIFGSIIASRNRIGIFDMIYPHVFDEVLLLVHQATVLEKWKAMFLSFNFLVQIYILISFFTFCIIAIKLKVFGQTRVKNNAFVILILFGYFVGTTHKNIQNKSSVRYLIVSWAVFTWLIACFYQSHLSSVFTKPTYYHQVKSLNEMYQQRFTLYMTERTYIYSNTTNSFDLGDLINRIVICDTMENSFDAISSGEKAGTIASVVLFNYYKDAYLDTSLKPKMYAIKPPISSIYITAYMKKGHPDLEKLRFLERQVLSGSFHRKRLSELIYQNTLSHIYSNTSHHYAGALDLKNVEGLYYVLLLGYVVSFILFLCELSRSNSKKIKFKR